MAEKKAEPATEHSTCGTEAMGAHSLNSSSSGSNESVSSSCEKVPIYTRMIDSFKPYEFKSDDEVDTSKMTDLEKINYTTSMQPLARKLKGRHLQMISIGSTIGTGLFVGSGSALWTSGPAGQLISYFLIGYSLYCVMNALAEMTVQFPVSGAFNTYFARFIDPSWGFTLGLLYGFSYLILLPLELIACSVIIGYWNNSINPSVWVAIFYVLVLVINSCGVKGFGEVEFVLSAIKVLAVIGFIILGVCLICGAGNGGYIGTRYWQNPGSFNNGFKGLCSSFVSGAFTFGGIELASLGAAETINPQKSLPRATKQVFWRITLFYIVTTVVIGTLVPYTDERLLSGKSGEDVTASAFVIAINNGGIRVLPDIMNAIILISSVSVCNASVYAASRTLSSLAVQGLLPTCIAYVDRMGRPLVGIMITYIFGLLGFLATDHKNQKNVFTWLYSICSLASFFIWSAICFVHMRWRWALKRQGRSLDEVLFVSPTGILGSVSAIVIYTLIVIAQIWTSIWPIGVRHASVTTFWQDCLSLPLAIILWAGYKTYTRSWGQFMVKLEDVDLDTGRRELDIDVIKQEVAAEKAFIQSKPFWYRVYRLWC